MIKNQFFSETQNTGYNIPTNKMQQRRKCKGSGSSENSEISMAYNRLSKTISVAGEAMGSDRERVVCRVHQLSYLEYNSPFYWDIVSLVENSETARQIRRLLCKYILNFNQINIIGHISKDLLAKSMELMFILWCLGEINEDIGIGTKINL